MYFQLAGVILYDSAYLLITGIVFTCNISDGLGIIACTVLNCRIKGRVNWLMVVISLLFVAKLIKD